jgi:peptide/nickel transport system permease protein
MAIAPLAQVEAWLLQLPLERPYRLSFGPVAALDTLLVRLTRAGAREAMLQDYVKFARAKGLAPRRVIGVHVLKNILIPIVTVIGLELGSVIAFAIVTESIFAWPGTGKLLIDSINQLDRPVIVAYLLVIVTIFIVINFVVDIAYSLLDPRVRLGGTPAHA